MVLRLYNTLTHAKETFVPLDPNNVRMYVCGPTVYDFAHIGNARPAIVFDVLFRLLRHLYGEEHVTYVRNITDVDDKINARANEIAHEKKISVEQARAELTAKTADQYHADVGALGCLRPTHEPRATEYIGAMVKMIETLIAAGHAYAADGHVLYDVSSKPDYGKLAHRSVNEMIAGARVEVAPYKRNPMDFVLWKPSKPGEPSWPSPWSDGRPGWHIECSAMAEACLKPGPTIDIHGGGIDLVFPHHENEVAQSEGAHHGHPLARYWMHNGFLQVEGEKMSKSLGNFVTINELLDSWGGPVLRLNMLKMHYRQPIDWTKASLKETGRELARWTEFVNTASPNPVAAEPMVAALEDDLNTSDAITLMRGLFRDKNASALVACMIFLGLDTVPASIQGRKHRRLYPETLHADDEFYPPTLTVVRSDGVVEIDAQSQQEIQKLVDSRNAARKAKNFKEADRIRDELLAKGIVLKDNANGTTTWEVKR